MNTLIFFSIGLRFAQGIFSYLNIAIQSNALSEADFIEFSVIMNAILLSAFLDLGIGIRFIQNHFLKRGNAQDEDAYLLDYLRRNLPRFLAVSIFQSVVISSYSALYYQLSRGVINDISLLTIFISCLIFSLSGLVARILIARGLIAESIKFQLYGLVFQFIISLIGLVFGLQMHFYILSLAVPNLVTAYFSLRLISGRSRQRKLLFPMISGQLSSVSLEIQTLQVLQFIFGIAPFIILAKNYSSTLLSENLIEWRIFSSVSAAMSSLNLVQWRNMAIRNSGTQNYVDEDSNLRLKVITGMALSISTAFVTYLCWDLLSGSRTEVNISNLLLWSIYVPVQVIQWHYYYQYLSSSRYDMLIASTTLQIISTIGSLFFLATSMSYRLPLSVLVGLLFSTVLFHTCQVRYLGEN